MQSKKGSFLLYLIPPLFLLLIVSGLVFWQWQSAGRQGLPEVSVTLDGTALQQRGGSWDVPVLGGLLTRHLEGSYPAIGTVLPVEQPQPALAVSPEDAAITGVRLQDTADQSVLYEGDAEGFAGFSFAEDGDYSLEVTLSLDRGTQGAGTFSFDATLEVRLPRPDPSFALSSSAPQQRGSDRGHRVKPARRGRPHRGERAGLCPLLPRQDAGQLYRPRAGRL